MPSNVQQLRDVEKKYRGNSKMKRGESEEGMVETNFCKINTHVNVNCSNYMVYICICCSICLILLRKIANWTFEVMIYLDMFVRYVIFLRYVNEKNCVFLDPHFFRDYVERRR